MSSRTGCAIHVGHGSGFSPLHRLVRPGAGAVRDAQDLDAGILDTVGHDVGRARDDQLACPWPAAGTAAVRQLGNPADRSLDALYDTGRRSLSVIGAMLLAPT